MQTTVAYGQLLLTGEPRRQLRVAPPSNSLAAEAARRGKGRRRPVLFRIHVEKNRRGGTELKPRFGKAARGGRNEFSVNLNKCVSNFDLFQN